MSMSFMQYAGRPVANVQQYLEESAVSPLRDKPTSNENARYYFIPSETITRDESGNEVKALGIRAYSCKIHDLRPSSSSYSSHICMKLDEPIKDENGNILYSGECPFCKRAEDAKDIVEYRLDNDRLLFTRQGFTGEALEKRLETNKAKYREELKISYGKSKLYVLVAKFITDKNGAPQMDKETGLPSYELKVLRLSKNQIDNIKKQFNTLKMTTGSEEDLPDHDMVVIYGTSANNNARDIVGDATYSAVTRNNTWAYVYPGLREKLIADGNNFDLSALSKAFPELSDITEEEANRKCNEALKLWDEYKARLAVDPNAVYAEYGTSVSNASYPNMNAQQIPQQVGALPNFGAPAQGQAMAAPNFGAQMPNFGTPDAGNVQMPGFGQPDANMQGFAQQNPNNQQTPAQGQAPQQATQQAPNGFPQQGQMANGFPQQAPGQVPNGFVPVSGNPWDGFQNGVN